MPNPENLKPFKKGVDERRNLKGAPKKLPILNEILSELLTDEVNGISKVKAIFNSLIESAINGDVRAAELILDRSYGKAKQSIDLTETKCFAIMNIDPLEEIEDTE